MALGKKFGNILGDYFGEEEINLQNQQSEQTPAYEGSKNYSSINEIRIREIKISEFQTRSNFDQEKIKALAESIAKSGLLQPVVVLDKTSDDSIAENFILLAGERRLRACLFLGYTSISAVVKKDRDLDKRQQAMITAFENLEREDLSPVELAETFQMLLNTQGVDEEGLATMLNKSAQYIKNYLRLLTLSRVVKKALLDRKITEGHARHLVGLPEDRQFHFLKLILEKDLSVKEVIALVKTNPSRVKHIKVVTTNHNINIDAVTKANRLAQQFPNAKIKFTGDDDEGKIIIRWKDKRKRK